MASSSTSKATDGLLTPHLSLFSSTSSYSIVYHILNSNSYTLDLVLVDLNDLSERTKESAEGWVVSRQPLHHHGTKIRRDEVKQPSRHIWRDVSVQFHVEYVLFHVLILASGHAWLRSASKWSGSYLVTHD